MAAPAQNTRINDHNQIGWVSSVLNYKLKERWSVQGELHWRRTGFLSGKQQNLVRTSVSYVIHPKVIFRAGYAWAETFPYGEYTINSFGREFTEHRLFQALTLMDRAGRIDFSHRFMLEERWVGRYSDPELPKEDEHVYLNRLRYQIRLQCPLKGPTIENREFYAAASNEILIGFGRNVNENVFDQNRLALLLGYKLNGLLRLEAGFFNHILQLGREVTLPGEQSGRNVFQRNNGFVFNSFWSFGK